MVIIVIISIIILVIIHMWADNEHTYRYIRVKYQKDIDDAYEKDHSKGDSMVDFYNTCGKIPFTKREHPFDIKNRELNKRIKEKAIRSIK